MVWAVQFSPAFWLSVDGDFTGVEMALMVSFAERNSPAVGSLGKRKSLVNNMMRLRR